jgi:hypothetical protein
MLACNSETLEFPSHPLSNALEIAANTRMMGGKQPDFSDYEPTTAKKQIKRENFLDKMEVIDALGRAASFY